MARRLLIAPIPKNQNSPQARYGDLWTRYAKSAPVFLPLGPRTPANASATKP